MAKFDTIQYRALKMCGGAKTGTELEALQSECGELPLALRRRMQQLRHSIKILSIPDHPASNVLRDHWANHYGRNTRTIYSNVKKFFEIYGENVQTVNLKLDPDPPWSANTISLDSSLSRVIRKSDPEINCKALALAMISGYDDRLHIYTDGSKDEEGHVAYSVCVPEKKVQVKHRISDKLSVFTAELVAIRNALELCRDYYDTGESRKIVIFSDSLSVIQSLDSAKPHNRPDIFKEISDLNKLMTNTVSIAWIPSHVGIEGNELADRLAKEALKHPTINTVLPTDKIEIYDNIDEYITHKWQEKWVSSRQGKLNKIIQPIVNNKVKISDTNRKKEVCWTRLRLGVCRLNHYLKIQNNHETGLCTACGVSQTIKHCLMSCKGSKIPTEVRNTCNKINLPFQLQSILNNRTTLQTIYDNLDVCV